MFTQILSNVAGVYKLMRSLASIGECLIKQSQFSKVLHEGLVVARTVAHQNTSHWLSFRCACLAELEFCALYVDL